MPVVPRAERTVEAAPMRGGGLNVGIPAGAFGGGMERPMAELEKVAAGIYEKQLKESNQIAVLDADVKNAEMETTLLYDPVKGLLNRKGKDAFGIYNEAQDEWNKHVRETEKSLTNPEQRLANRNRVVARWADIDRQLQRHIFSERKRFDDTITESLLTNEQDAAVRNYSDEGRIGISIETQRAVITDHARRNGLPPEWLKMKVQESESKTHVGVINAMLTDGNDIMADSYYKANKAMIAGADSASIGKALEEGSLRGASQRNADEIMAKNLPLAEALKKARKIPDPKLRDETERRVKQYYSAKDTAEKMDAEDRYLNAVNLMERNKGKSPRDVVSPADWTRFSISERTALEQRGEAVRNDDKAWVDFIALGHEKIAAMSRPEFETRYWAKFDNGHRGRAETMWLAAKEGEGKADKFTAIIAPVSITESIWQSMGLGNPSDNAEAFSTFEQEVQRQVVFYETALGGKRKSTPEELRKIAGDVALKNIMVDVDKSWFPTGTTTMPLGERKPEDKVEGIYVKKVERTGEFLGRKVIKYTDGSAGYAD